LSDDETHKHTFLVVKYGYPPVSLGIDPSLAVSSLGLKHGDQIIVSASSDILSYESSTRAKPTVTASDVPARPPSWTSTPEATIVDEDSVEVDGGILVLRV
jgi:hypothetical protein